jgi:hypothetical protein
VDDDDIPDSFFDRPPQPPSDLQSIILAYESVREPVEKILYKGHWAGADDEEWQEKLDEQVHVLRTYQRKVLKIMLKQSSNLLEDFFVLERGLGY